MEKFLNRVAQFVYWTAKDALIELLFPDVVKLPIQIAQNFYRCFLAIEANEQKELLVAAGSLTDTEIDELTRAIATPISNGEMSDAPQTRDSIHEVLEVLRRAAHSSAAKHEPAEAVRQSLNERLSVHGSPLLQSRKLSSDQSSVGRLLTSCLLNRPLGDFDRDKVEAAVSIPGYRFLRPLGRGGFASVYLAQHDVTGELRAVKIGPLCYPDRLRREIEVLRAFQHPHLVRYIEHGMLDRQFWITMEYLGDNSLADLLAFASTRPNPEQALLIGEQILRGLAVLHDKRIIHRDLKPANVMVDESFRLRLIDFGLVKLYDAEPRALSAITIPGELLGTPFYMSPEQADGEASPTPASDVWSFGVMMYEMLVGELPFQGKTIMALGREIHTRQIELEQDSIPTELQPILRKCLQRAPAKRFADSVALLDDYATISKDLRRRLRHERYRAKWLPVVENRLLEQFAAVQGTEPDDVVARFRIFANEQGVLDVDEERLTEILPPILGQQVSVRQAARDVDEFRLQLQRDVMVLGFGELSLRVQQFRMLEDAHAAAISRLSCIVHELLADEVKSWQQLREAERQAGIIKRQQEEADRVASADLEIAQAEANRLARSRQENAEKEREQRLIWQFWLIMGGAIAIVFFCFLLGFR